MGFGSTECRQLFQEGGLGTGLIMAEESQGQGKVSF